MKRQYKLKSVVNPKIKVGDSVYLIDGSALSNDKSDKEYYIVFAYRELTGRQEKLKEIKATVLETNITDNILTGSIGIAYIQDITVQIGDAVFRTCSGMVWYEGSSSTVYFDDWDLDNYI